MNIIEYMDYREIIKSYIAQAIDGTINYSGDNYEQNKASWLEIATDRAIATIVRIVPPPIDVESKYEVGNDTGIWLNLDDNTPENEQHNQEQLVHLAKFADDRGYNRYHDNMMNILMKPYVPLQNEGMFANITNEGEANGTR